MIKIPCIEEKCLLYPACKHKSLIYCKDLTTYVSSLYKRELTKESHGNMWLDLNKQLPYLNRVFPEPKKYVKLETISLQSRYSAEYLRNMNETGERFKL